MQESVRSFVAVDLSAEARDTIAQALQELRRDAPRDVRWVDPEGMHLTIKYLGSVPSGGLDTIKHALQTCVNGVAPFDIGLGTSGAFPNLWSPRVLWVGFTGDVGALNRLRERVEVTLVDIGYAREK